TASHKVYREAQAQGKAVLISKEKLCHERWKKDCDYHIFPDLSSLQQTKPAFLFRDPLRVFDSWKAVGWSHVESLLTAYRSLYNSWSACHQPAIAIAITYEELISHPEQTLQLLCRHWDLPFSQDLLSFQHSFCEFLFSSERERQIYVVDNPLGLFNIFGERSHRTQAGASVPEHLRLAHLTHPAQPPAKDPLRLRLRRHLHEFRKASSTASAAVFHHLAAHHPPTTPEALKATYAHILSQTASAAFADPAKTSTDYRSERFTALMHAHDIPTTEKTLQHLLDLYKYTLRAALVLKPRRVRPPLHPESMHETVFVITEGPEDVQRWTVEELGIAGMVDVLITSNRVGKGKTEGLFAAALRELGFGAGEMVFVGDSWTMDVLPAGGEGILAVWYDEAGVSPVRFLLALVQWCSGLRVFSAGSVRLDEEGNVKVNSLWKVRELVGASKSSSPSTEWMCLPPRGAIGGGRKG
ncbi:MAG: hypothetical protein LQ345_004658, partial [Seirophora villosa]